MFKMRLHLLTVLFVCFFAIDLVIKKFENQLGLGLGECMEFKGSLFMEHLVG